MKASTKMYLPNGARIVAIDFNACKVFAHCEGKTVEPYVIWSFPVDNLAGTYSGHYFSDFDEAKDFYSTK